MILEITVENIILLQELVKIEKEIFSESYYSIETLKEMIIKNDYKILVFNKRIDGYLILHDSYDLYEIMKIGVRKELRKNKIGYKLIEFYLKNFDKNLFLEVRESNEVAKNFYEKIGFINIGKRKNYYPNGETAILMSLERN
ncbi:MAG: ribosomal protein S18-alanine N-acetyltransferase [Cetobacterium sp.]|uniref:ribosomal protein S18-alanine N-acetyltransferase n=1 Tax=Cetobacterium sp. TaxID=2071632 RepID=UPI003F3AB9AB